MPKSQGSSNHQPPKGRGWFGYWGLEFLWCLEFGIWILTPRALDCAQRLQKGLTFVRQLLLKSFCAIAIAAGPRFGAVFVTTIPARVGVLSAEKIEIFFPIRTFFRERGIAKTGFNPSRNAAGIQARLAHVMNVLVACDRTFAQCPVVDRLEQRLRFPRFYSCFNQITHSTR